PPRSPLGAPPLLGRPLPYTPLFRSWLTRMRETSASGTALRSRSNVSSVQLTAPSGAFTFCTRLRFFSSSPALATRRAFSIVCSRSEEPSELQSRSDLVCRLLLEKKQ